MKKLICLLLAALLALSALPALADGTTVTIVNRDRVNVRDDKGTSFGRINCYVPVTVLQVQGDKTLISFPRALMEIWKDEFTLSEYVGTYSGEASGWVNSICLSPSADSLDTLWYLAEECRWEVWVEGIYHQIQSYGLSRNKNYETHEAPLIDGKPLEPHTSAADLAHWNDPTWTGVDERAQLKSQARGYAESALAVLSQTSAYVQPDTADRLALVLENVFELEQLNDSALEQYGEGGRLVAASMLASLYSDIDVCFLMVQLGASSMQDGRDRLMNDLSLLLMLLN